MLPFPLPFMLVVVVFLKATGTLGAARVLLKMRNKSRSIRHVKEIRTNEWAVVFVVDVGSLGIRWLGATYEWCLGIIVGKIVLYNRKFLKWAMIYSESRGLTFGTRVLYFGLETWRISSITARRLADSTLTIITVDSGIMLTCITCNRGALLFDTANLARTKIKDPFWGFQAVSDPLRRSLTINRHKD